VAGETLQRRAKNAGGQGDTATALLLVASGRDSVEKAHHSVRMYYVYKNKC